MNNYAGETNSLINPTEYHSIDRQSTNLYMLAEMGGRVTRVRMFTERLAPGAYIYDVSYVYGELPDGTQVRVINCPLGEVMPPRHFAKVLVNWAKEEGVFAKKIGLLDPAVLSTVN